MILKSDCMDISILPVTQIRLSKDVICYYSVKSA